MAGKRTRYARGTISLNKRVSGEHAWIFRYKDEHGKYRGIQFATTRDCRTRDQARIEADRQHLKEKHVLRTQEAKKGRKTFTDLIGQYRKEEIPERYSTQHSYESWLNLHIAPRWGETYIDSLEPAAVEQWLKESSLSPKSKAHIKGLMTVLMNFAMKWNWIPFGRNPMELVEIKGGIRRRTRPRILSQQQFAAFFAEMKEQYLKVASVLLMCLGPRLSEVLGLKWADIDGENFLVSVRRAVVQGREGDVKTEYSEAELPLDPELAEVLSDWRKETEFAKDNDWVFASPFQAGEKPYFPTAVRRKILAAAEAAGLGELFAGEPTKIMRHSYRSWLGTTNAPVGVIKDLMRHADIRTTMNVYGNGMQPAMRKAHGKVVKMVLKPGRARVTSVSRKLSNGYQ